MPTYQNIVAMWKNKDKNGNTYLSMVAERDIKKGEKINVFANDKGGNDARPDFRAYEKLDDEPQVSSNQADDIASGVPF